MKKIIVNENQLNIIKENIKVTTGEKGKKTTCQAKWDDEKDCPICGEKMYFTMTISDGGTGRGKIKVTDENGEMKTTEVQTVALYYCPHCYKFTALNNMA